MPTGATLPFITYKDTGVQSVTSTLTPLEDENVVSTFLSNPSRTYLHGCNDVIVEGEISVGTNTLADIGDTNADAVKFQTFRIPDDCDAISKISFCYEFIVDNNNASEKISKTLGFELIDKVEVRIGNHLWQTLTGADIFARNITESNYASSNELFDTITNLRGNKITTWHGRADTTKGTYTLSDTGDKYNVSGIVDLKIFSGSGNKINSFLQNGAPNNHIILKIFYNDVDDGKVITTISQAKYLKNFKLIVKKHNFTDVERNYINNNIINSVIHTSQGIQFSPGDNIKAINATENQTTDITIDLSTFTINASHLLVSITNSPYSTPTSTDMVDEVAGLYSQGFGALNALSITKGLFDVISSIDLKINGSSVTGELPASYLRSSSHDFMGLKYMGEVPIYCIPLASEAFGSDCIVLSKLNNKKLFIKMHNNLLGGNVSNSRAVINVTAVGTNIATYVGGECNLQISN